MKFIYLSICLLLLTSCATLFNKDDKTLYFYSDTNIETLQVKDSIYDLPLEISVLRSKEDLQFTLSNDSLTKEYRLLSETDTWYSLGNVLMPLGYLIEGNSIRRYTYKDKLYLNLNDEVNILGSAAAQYDRKQKQKRSLLSEKGEVFLYLTYAPLNFLSFDLAKYDKTQHNIGTWLGDIGAVYYYADDRFLKMGIGLNSSANIVPMEYNKTLISTSLQLMNVHQFKHLNIGYGLFAGRHFYRQEVEAENPKDKNLIYTGNQTTAGIALSTHFRISNTLSVGLSYQSSLYRLSSPSKFSNSHVVSLELTRLIRLTKKKPTMN